jgi:regulator of replication initiation timing
VKLNLDAKIEVSVGCVEYLTKEVENLRQENKMLRIENTAINRFLTLIESITPKNQSIGYGEDRLWQAKREIENAVESVEKESMAKSERVAVAE